MILSFFWMQPYDSNMETCLVFCKDINSVVPKWKKYEIKVKGEFRKDILSGYNNVIPIWVDKV